MKVERKKFYNTTVILFEQKLVTKKNPPPYTCQVAGNPVFPENNQLIKVAYDTTGISPISMLNSSFMKNIFQLFFLVSFHQLSSQVFTQFFSTCSSIEASTLYFGGNFESKSTLGITKNTETVIGLRST